MRPAVTEVEEEAEEGTCTARFLAAMIGSGRQCLLNRRGDSRCEYTLS